MKKARNREPFSFNKNSGIDGDDVLVIGEEGIDVDLLDLCGEAEEGGETHDDLSILLIL